ncbi:bacteriocin immunity protein [Klebsiella quasipneumoniae]
MMDNKKSISDYTESEFLAFVEKIFKPDNTTEDEDVQNVLEFERITEHPNGSDLLPVD